MSKRSVPPFPDSLASLASIEHDLVYGWPLNEACRDPYVLQQIHYNALTERLATEHDRLVAHAVLLHEHPELHDDLARCRADLAAVLSGWEGPIQAANTTVARRALLLERDCAWNLLFRRTIAWLWHCYRAIWAELEGAFGVPDFLVVEAIRKAVTGTWQDAVAELGRTPEIVVEGDGTHALYADMIARIAASDLPPAKSAQRIARWTADEVKGIEVPGRAPVGRPTEYKALMELYRRWHAWRASNRRREEFYRAVQQEDEEVRVTHWRNAPPTRDGIKHQLQVAGRWLAPRRDKVPASPKDYLSMMGS